ncbi:hypothetical protein KVG90_21695 [Klebsiella pneumoniae]|uniref:hypothetical protein n=1 Tax=Klebsiella pneumoniae TaxID=573 RepID=UPI00217EC4A0|nr:hypothetical protein [Klebsiella pneumoniae]MCS6411436.1 hypothetical protein [Klebsiella pneumoniae]
MSEEKAKYRVLRLSHIANQLWPEGSEVEYDGIPGTALEPINDAAKAAKAKAERKGEAAKTIIPNGTGNPPVPGGNSNQPGPEGGNGGNGKDDEDLAELQQQYEQLFQEKPHFNVKAETLRKKIAEKRSELGL